MRTILERISMYKRKTLGKSRKMASRSQKDNISEEKNAYIVELDGYRYELSEKLAGKRIEELSRNEMDEICGNKK